MTLRLCVIIPPLFFTGTFALLQKSCQKNLRSVRKFFGMIVMFASRRVAETAKWRCLQFPLWSLRLCERLF